MKPFTQPINLTQPVWFREATQDAYDRGDIVMLKGLNKMWFDEVNEVYKKRVDKHNK